ncbi:sensor histidine kinase [Pseudoalteromonas sp. SWXJ133]|uniref:ATP-binding protein n=1 Tax=Pseudoalteromonas sp. SWXJ133 TaxID=2792069 RepID=UPI0018CE1897|nr:ATP-binding protein [Pseudoalteromonas sp. SWXJ133]MBH0021262.1 sensor histidine kinase [Pseudoalteromonas sp. SWXJ133]
MFSFSKRIIAVGLLLILILVVTFWVGRAHDIDKATVQAQGQVTQLNNYIDTELVRFSAIPQLLTYNQLMIDFVSGEHQHYNAINNYLADIQQASGSSDIFVLNTQGEVTASSNWQVDNTFLGSNFAFRPYFKRAFAGEKVAYFALGMRSKERGIYFSQAIYHEKKAVGVVVLKVNVSKFENDRELLNTSMASHFYLQLADDVIAMSDVQAWRLNSFRKFDITQRRNIKLRRAYLDHQPTYIEQFQYTSEGVTHYKIDNKLYVSAAKPLRYFSANMYVLVDVTSVNPAQLPRLFWASIIYGLVTIIGYSLLARFAGYKKLLYSRHSLEAKVIERTQELEKAQVALVQSAKLATIGQLSAGINHEINQPLSAINTYLASAKRLLAKGNTSALGESLVVIEGLVNRVHQIVGQLKHFSKPSKMQLRPYPLAGLVNNALMISSAQLKQDNVQVEPPQFDETVVVWVDSLKFEQVLVNLITNASQAMNGAIIRNLSFQLECFEERVKLSILDTGSGIEQHAFGNLFEPFYSTKSSKGLGLGLSISKQIIDSFNGCLSAHNRVEGGAEFIISLSNRQENKDD